MLSKYHNNVPAIFFAVPFVIVVVLMGCGYATCQQERAQCRGGRIYGVVHDPTGAVIVGATVTTLDGVIVTDSAGTFTIPCAEPDTNIHVAAQGFSPFDFTSPLKSEQSQQTFNITLQVETATTIVEAVTDSSTPDSSNSNGELHLSKDVIDQLADDPDDFTTELQMLAATSGSSPSNTIITVNGFQDSATLPPKESIASIRINPDLFSAEYASPPYKGGHIEIFTKPSTAEIHGSLFGETSNSFLNARDPFSVSKAAIGRRRFGFSIGTPLKKNRIDLLANLEKRDIDDFAVVNAVTLGANDISMATEYNVPAGQHLIIGALSSNIATSAKTAITFGFTAYHDEADNVGVGGTTLQEAGYGSDLADYAVRGSAITTINSDLLHELRVGLTFHREADSPVSTAPGIDVAGAFTGGGSSIGPYFDHETRLEWNEDLLISRGQHNLKAGVIATTMFDRLMAPTNFNGIYTFGGGEAPPIDASGHPTSTVNIAISGLEQYRRALLGYVGGEASTYSVTTGTPKIGFTLIQGALYIQDQWNAVKGLQISSGLRYSFQDDPSSFSNIAPRIGTVWSPSAVKKLILSGHIGIFYSGNSASELLPVLQFNDTRQAPSTYYNATFSNPIISTSTAIRQEYRFSPHLMQQPNWQAHAGIEYELPGHWHAQSNSYYLRGWNIVRIRNINSPFDDSPTGIRPIDPDRNIYQFQPSGIYRGTVLFMGLSQSSYRHLQLTIGYVRSDIRSNADSALLSPQSAYSDQGEVARPSWQSTHRMFALGTMHLPKKVELSTVFGANSGIPFNLTTGFDNNGDGVFNDRPQYATSSSVTTYATKYGTLTPVGGIVSVSRNLGTLPWQIHLDTNLSKSFTLKKSASREQAVNVNLRSTNLVNHTNVSAVGGILGSPLFDVPYQADSGRRIEAGVHYSF